MTKRTSCDYAEALESGHSGAQGHVPLMSLHAE